MGDKQSGNGKIGKGSTHGRAAVPRQVSRLEAEKNNVWAFGPGTLGRDAMYTMVTMYLIFYLTDVLNVSVSTLWAINLVYLLLRIFDAVNDPFMGMLVDNTRTKRGKFKPWILFGAMASGVFMIFLFTDFGLKGWTYVLYFTVVYILFEVSYTVNDLAFWSMLPALSEDQTVREKIGSVARICANIGMFGIVVGIIPITNFLAGVVGSMIKAYQVLAMALVAIMFVFQLIPVIFCLEKTQGVRVENTGVREMVKIIFKNDQLLWVTLGMLLFMTGYTTTASLGIYYFKYIYGNENMYSLFALVLGVSQISALIAFPYIRKKMSRNSMYLLATVMVCLGYALFFFSNDQSMIPIVVSGISLFAGQAMIQLLMLMFITDTVEYGEWKFNKRNDSVTFSLQPFIYKMAGALASGLVGVTLILSGIKTDATFVALTSSGRLIFKMAMLVLPLLLILIGYLVLRRKYRLDETTYQTILNELKIRRGENST